MPSPWRPRPPIPCVHRGNPAAAQARAGPLETAALTLHRLLAAILRAQPPPQADLPTRAVRLLRAALPTDNPLDTPQVWPTWRQFLPNVLFATDSQHTLAGVEQDVAWLLDRAGLYLPSRGEPATARSLLERALHLRRSWLGNDHPDTLRSAHSLAAVRDSPGEPRSDESCRSQS